MEEVVLHTSPLAPEPDTQRAPDAVVIPSQPVEEEIDPMTVPMKEIISGSPHIDSNASKGDNLALLPRNTVIEISDI